MWMLPWLLLITGSVLAQNVVQIDESVSEYNFMPNELMYYLDRDNRLGFDDVSASTFANRFKAHPGYQNKDFDVNAAYWVRIPIQTPVATSKIWLLEFYDQTIDQIDAFLAPLKLPRTWRT